MAKARRAKHLFGGAMRQAGIVAAAGVYALEHNVKRLADDHARARRLAEGCTSAGVPVDLEQVETNFVQVDVAPLGLGAAEAIARLEGGGVGSRHGAADEAPRRDASRRRRRGHRARDRARSARARGACPRLSLPRLLARRSSAGSGCRASARPSSAAASVSGRRRSGSPTPSAASEATPEHQYRDRLDHEDVHGRRRHAAPRRGQARPRRPARAHLPRLRTATPTLRRLLSHASGLQREMPGEVWETLRIPDARGAARAARARPSRCSRRGERWHYSNLAFVLLGEVVARVSGTPYEAYVEERILGPLGLERTTWEPTAPHARGYFVDPYADRVRRRADARARRHGLGGPALVDDGRPRRWAAFLADPDPVLAPASAEEMHALQAMADPTLDARAGASGSMLYRRGERIFVGHDGAMPGFLAIVSSPREGTGSAPSC